MCITKKNHSTFYKLKLNKKKKITLLIFTQVHEYIKSMTRIQNTLLKMLAHVFVILFLFFVWIIKIEWQKHGWHL